MQFTTRFRGSRMFLSVTAIFLTSACAIAAAPAEKQTPFVGVIEKNFAAWDVNHDGTLSKDEVNALVADAKIKGDDAAAVATLKLALRNTKIKTPDLTMTYFAAYNEKMNGTFTESQESAVAKTTDTIDNAPRKDESVPYNWDRFFLASKARIAKSISGPQWQPEKIDIAAIRQGKCGDCFFIACMGSTAVHRPTEFQKFITMLPDGSYQASFPGVQPFTFPARTEAELALGATSSSAGASLPLLEQAFGRYKAMLKKGKTDDVEGTDILTVGGDSAVTIGQLTGHKANRIVFGKNVETRTTQEEKVMPELRKAILASIADDRIITVGAGTFKKPATAEVADATGKLAPYTLPYTPPSINRNHVYALVAYDAKSDMVDIWNPHGQNFSPKGTPGLENGYETKNGVFHLPLRDAYMIFASFTFETKEALPEKSNETKAAVE